MSQVALVDTTTGTSSTLPATVIEGSPSTSVPASSLINCGLGTSVCTGATGKICVISRGTNSFCEKVSNCYQGGGVGTIVYDNANNAWPVAVTLGSSTSPCNSIPSVIVPQ